MIDTIVKLTPSKEHGGLVMVMEGRTKKGRDALLSQYAEQEGMTIDQARLVFNDAPAGIVSYTKNKTNNKDRLAAIKDAYWSHTSAHDHDIIAISDMCLHALDKRTPYEGLRIVFDLFPYAIIGLGIRYGFGDLSVRTDMYKFIKENEVEIKKLLEDNGF